MTWGTPVVETRPELSASDWAIQAIDEENTLTATIIPHLVIIAATLPNALESIRQENRRLVADPAKRGLGFILKTTPPPKPPASPFLISLDLTGVSVMDALRAVAAQAGLKVRVEPSGILLIPVSEYNATIATVTYKVGPAAIGLATGYIWHVPGSPVPHGRQDARDWLTAHGITFPLGTSATYHFDFHTLTIRNTQENLDRIDILLSHPVTP